LSSGLEDQVRVLGSGLEDKVRVRLGFGQCVLSLGWVMGSPSTGPNCNPRKFQA